jgi:acyl-homoserine-lactone acylase
MRRSYLAIAALALPATVQAQSAPQERWKAEAARVTITRDDWGIAHVKGHTDADAVFGAIYAQAEDDFSRIEANYLTNLGRTAEADGEKAIWLDLRQRLYVDPAKLKSEYAASPASLRELMDAWADGLNWYLATHPDVHPRVLTHFEPWMALSFTEGSIGGDIERISLSGLQTFYGATPMPPTAEETGARPQEPKGSNGIAIAPRDSANGHALLLINPHTSFYFRAELQMTSDQGLNAYGASTWGQFFIYQGWNEQTGWMHTSSTVDNVDEFAEKITKTGDKLTYRYGPENRPVESVPITIRYRQPDGTMAERTFTTYRTHHGPIVGVKDGKWIAEALMWRPIPALEQSWLRTKQHDLASYLKIAGLQANSSNNTLFADQKGEIAYLHPQFVPIRSGKFDYTKLVDGSDPETDWKGLHGLASLPQAINPASGWAFNTNNEPWSAAGVGSIPKSAYPAYMDQTGENERGKHALILLNSRHNFTHDTLRDAAFDSFLPAFSRLLPQLFAAYEALPDSDPRKASLAQPIALLKSWDDRWGADSTATSLAVYWGDTLWGSIGASARTLHMQVPDYIADKVTPEVKIAALQQAVERLTKDFGSWQVKWGEINRFQRLDDAIVPHFDDAKPSIPVPFTSSQWGSLASFGARPYPNTKRYYGTSGNSFVAIVEFGPRVEGWAFSAGGESGDPASPHFIDQAERYAAGNFRKAYFWPDEIQGHVVKTYTPGE